VILFVDESGQDRRESPYEVLGGVAVPQAELWPWIKALRGLLVRYFGDADHGVQTEIKGCSFLTRKRLRQAFGEEIPGHERQRLVLEFFRINQQRGQPRRQHFDAYAQACRFFCRDVLQTCRDHSARVLAAIVSPAATPQIDGVLRADYVGLFSKLYQCTADDSALRALIIHDERDDSECRDLAKQLYAYYVNEDRDVPLRVIPEPLFVKSHLTLGIMVADIVTYVLAWGFRYAEVLSQPYRPDLREFAELIREINGIPADPPRDLEEYGIVYVEDLSDAQKWQKISSQPEQTAPASRT
jgi:hypothetical protein